MKNRIVHASSKQVVRPGGFIDQFRRNLTDSLTPERLGTIMQEIDDGDVAAMSELAQEMEAKDAHLQAVANTRRQAVTALDWSIEPATTEKADDAFAIEVAKFCEDTLRSILEWPDTLDHLSRAIGPGIAVTELVWHRSKLVKTVDVPGDRLWESEPGDLRVLTDSRFVDGEEIKYGKWIVATPNALAGFPLRVTLTRASARLYIIKHYASADWTSFAEIFGMPIRMAYWDPENPPSAEERQQAENMLKDMGTDTWGLLPAGMRIEFQEVGRGTHPFAELIDWCETKLTILWLGQTLTTDVGDVGSFAAAKIHNNVRATILAADLKDEARTIETQVLEPIVRLRWPARNVATPRFKRNIREERNLDAERLEMEKGRFMRELGIQLSDAQWREMLNIPPLDGEPLGQQTPEEPTI